MQHDIGLVGHTGLVGKTLLQRFASANTFHRANLADLAGRYFDLLILSALPAEKWKANQDPVTDWSNLCLLCESLKSVAARRVLLVSTIDVLPAPVVGDETTVLDSASLCAYGRHRAVFEFWVRSVFSHVQVLRLPGLFGSGLKKNLVFDLIRDRELHKIHPEGRLQWYPLARLPSDVDRLLAAPDLSLLHCFPQPVRTADLVRQCFPDRHLTDALPRVAAPFYDARSRHAMRLWGRGDGYCMSAVESIAALQHWLTQNAAMELTT